MSEMDELEAIRMRKLEEMAKRFSPSGRSAREEVISATITVTDASLSEIIRKHPLVVVDCWATWCRPCQMIAPVIDEMARDYAGKIVFGKLNVDENPATSRQFRIMSIPALLVFKNGVLVDQIIGAAPRATLESRIKRYI